MPPALLICVENTFWDQDINGNHDGSYVELFEKSFTLYVESGMRDKTERDIIDILRNKQGELLVRDKGFKTMFYKFIVDHHLRKFFVSICNCHI